MSNHSANHICLNLKSMTYASADPANQSFSWLMTLDGSMPAGWNPERIFLISTQADHEWVRKGAATPLAEARRFLSDVLAGRIASCVPGRLYDHLRALEATDGDPFEVERLAFGAQFNLEEPTLGLQGFLTKNKQPFTCPPDIKPVLVEILSHPLFGEE